MTQENPFSSLVVPVSDKVLSDTVRRVWVAPLSTRLTSPEAGDALAKMGRMPRRLVDDLLGQKDLRSRVAGAYYAALFGRSDMIDVIGRLLLKSEVPRAGAAYAVVLADFGGDRAVGYLRQYLEYYLKRHDFDYDQVEVMAALRHLDMKMGKDFASEFLPLWETFRLVRKKGDWALSSMLLVQERELRVLQEFRTKRAHPLGFLSRFWVCLRRF